MEWVAKNYIEHHLKERFNGELFNYEYTSRGSWYFYVNVNYYNFHICLNRYGGAMEYANRISTFISNYGGCFGVTINVFIFVDKVFRIGNSNYYKIY